MGLGSKEVWGLIFNDNDNGKGHELLTCILIDIAQVDEHAGFPKPENVLMFLMFAASEMFNA